MYLGVYFYSMLLLDTFWSHVWHILNHWDQWLFLKINTEWTNKFLDSVYPWYRDSNTWMPLYLFLFLFSVLNFGWRIWPWILFFILTVTLTDQISSTFIKSWINRTRPCHDEALINQVHLLLNYCPGNCSCTSSHAANHCGAACYIFDTMRNCFIAYSLVLHQFTYGNSYHFRSYTIEWRICYGRDSTGFGTQGTS